MKRWKSAEFGAKRLSPEIQTKQHCRLIVPRSVTLIGTAPDAARYSTARVCEVLPMIADSEVSLPRRDGLPSSRHRQGFHPYLSAAMVRTEVTGGRHL
jgi:hypothetical protein